MRDYYDAEENHRRAVRRHDIAAALAIVALVVSNVVTVLFLLR